MSSTHRSVIKSLLRNKLQQSCCALSRGARKRKSRVIAGRFLREASLKKASRIMLYMALPSEVETQTVLRKLLQRKKHVYVPKVNTKGRTMQIFEVRNQKRDLRKGAFGILEPREVKSRSLNPSQLDVVVIPGVGFDKNGRRLGRGAGYFDRFLKKANRAKKIGFAFREQMLKKIPTERHDVRLDKVITD